MVRIALIADIHGNLTALEAVLADAARQYASQIICLGDVAATGPQPREALERVRALGCPVVMGNADAELLAEESWFRAQLSEEQLSFVHSFAPSLSVELPGAGRLLCFHGSPRSNTELILPATPAAELDEVFAGCEATVLAGGHTHVQMVRRHRKRLIVNPGSVGLPYDQNPWSGEVDQAEVRLAPWAEYALLTCDGGSLGVELRRVPVDVSAVRQTLLGSGWPDAAGWAALWGTQNPAR